ncbi:MAG: hypothetical protein ABIP13_03605 [Tepidiformaceae bacterium]
MLNALRILSLVVVVFTATALVASPVSASKGLTDRVSGFETYASSNEGRFVGTATGDLPGTWSAVVIHDQLSGASPALITDGSFDLETFRAGSPVTVSGAIAGGTVTQVSGFSGCANQQYAVVGTFDPVSISGGQQDGKGTFRLTLTHYRTSVFGYCFPYSATVTGSVSFKF